ncbi:MAG: enoyl-CoA hydratase/isomerase family protein [Proteobacteria bacterium]|nr:enoyl-CoA hydratase/isomerase family protein [Pseudomonadota bacterium]MBU1389982.1 enoyl-CoA hydratase/isomerase family protein [Pseudomonadota bacterium]MBU1545067.1 enoyl-CoA hydratase/isomerase family protein [Pseudomonadota bacterium]MBU2429066.1 enoyl-CoA hydratase/isomerase family protein [Pseudomonadota bacterium]MBU2480888.1 enoyl-CoA hydratase/isomerase family protein [Pseudomonadota bacterium]
MIRKIRKAAVIGSGIMGGGIAALLAGAGADVLLLDIVPFDLTDEEKKDKAARNRIVEAGFKGALAAAPALFFDKKDAARISTGNLEDDIDQLGECDWIIEVVVENLKIKQDLFARIEKVRKPGSIVSSNTSGIPLKDISANFSKEFKQHFMGTHFFNPVRYMHLLELIPGEDTLPEILEFIAGYGEKNLGKGIVWAKDTPNFVGNRIGVQGIAATVQAMLEDGLSIAEVDLLFGAALGRPKTAVFKTTDMVGLDTMIHVSKNSYELCTADEKRETLKLPEFINQMAEKKLLGNKTKAGFYKTELTPEWKKIRKVLNPATMEYEDLAKVSFPCIDAAKTKSSLKEKIQCVLDGDDKGAKFAWKMSINSFQYAANRIPEIADTIIEIDNSMKWGYNFEMGPFETWDAYGVKKAADRMAAEGYEVPANVKAMLNAGNDSFYKMENGVQYYYDFVSKTYVKVPVSKTRVSLAAAKGNNKTVLENSSASLVDIGDGVFCFEFHTKMNAINAEIVDMTAQASEYVDKNGVGLVIGNEAGGMPGAFSAGADLSFVSKLIKDKKFAEIEAFLKGAHETMQKNRYAAFPIVAAPYGMTLGGGCEACLSADRIVAHSELIMGLVEIGVGLLPGGGGCLNLWRKYIKALPGKTAKDMDLAKLFVPVFMNISTASISMSAAQAVGKGFLGLGDRIVMNRDNLIGEAKKEVLKMVDDGYVPPAKDKLIVMGDNGQGMVASQIYNMLNGGFMSEYDAFLAKRIAFVVSGGNVKMGAMVDEETILKLERDAFVDFCKEEKTQARIAHMLTTGKPLRN